MCGDSIPALIPDHVGFLLFHHHDMNIVSLRFCSILLSFTSRGDHPGLWKVSSFRI